MPYCPSCNTEYREGFTECADCRLPLVEGAAPTAARPGTSPGEWIGVYTGRGAQVSAVEQNLQSHGFRVVRTPVEQSGALPVGMLGTDSAALYTLAVPAAEAEARAAEMERSIAEMTGADPGDPEAQAEAEQDYDVRGCPTCSRYFHDNYAACPQDGVSLVPAVEVFEEGQLEPDRVIVGDGPPDDAEALASRLRGAGFDAHAGAPAGWPTTLVDLPWTELIARTEAAEQVLRASGR